VRPINPHLTRVFKPHLDGHFDRHFDRFSRYHNGGSAVGYGGAYDSGYYGDYYGGDYYGAPPSYAATYGTAPIAAGPPGGDDGTSLTLIWATLRKKVSPPLEQVEAPHGCNSQTVQVRAAGGGHRSILILRC
jgi:hypothetical protein